MVASFFCLPFAVSLPPFSLLPYFHLPEDCARLMSSLFLSASISQPCYSISQLVNSCCCCYIFYYGNTYDHTALKNIRLLFPCSSTTDERHQEEVQGSLSRLSMTRRKKTKTKKEEDKRLRRASQYLLLQGGFHSCFQSKEAITSSRQALSFTHCHAPVKHR
jgi:hypothetical protein